MFLAHVTSCGNSFWNKGGYRNELWHWDSLVMTEASSQKLSPQFLMIAEVLIRMRHFSVHVAIIHRDGSMVKINFYSIVRCPRRKLLINGSLIELSLAARRVY